MLRHLHAIPRGIDLLSDPVLNKGSAFTPRSGRRSACAACCRRASSLQADQVERNLVQLRKRSSDLDRYIDLMDLMGRNVTLFYRLLTDHLEEMMPIVYTPTVGQACLKYGVIFRRPQGIFLTADDRGSVRKVLANWPRRNVKVIVVTDGERILGLGDLGAYGMGIPIGKLSLYTACAGVHPALCLPITIDVGTDNADLLNDPFYLGLNQRRLRGPAYDELMDEFMDAVQQLFPGALVQLEDFGTGNAFRLLHKYRDQACVFDDDIQGTAAVTLAGIYSALRLTGGKLEEQRLLFLGAGEAGIGIGELTASALAAQGVPLAEARTRCWFVDSRGLVVRSRHDLTDHKRPFAHEHAEIRDFLEAVHALKPTAIIGVSAKAGLFTREVLEAMAKYNPRPIVFALSNPTSKAECTAREAYTWTQGRAIYASGSPFEPVTLNGQTFRPGQGNNAYIFPGVGLGAIAVGAARVTDEMFAAAARTLADEVSDGDLKQGLIFPPLGRIRDVSAKIAVEVARVAFRRNLTSMAEPADLAGFIRGQMYDPTYGSYA
jgi:malate dehydrogenase (oxaloacetate-decarboxylating)(NADP+)